MSEFEGIDLVIHLAGLVSFSMKDKDDLYRIHVHGTRNVVRAALHHHVKLYVNISSVAALGFNDDRDCPVDEQFEFNWNLARRRKKHYMLSKHLADLEVERARENGLQAIILYPGLMYGPGDVGNTGQIFRIFSRHGTPFFPPGGTNVVDVRDVANGIVKSMKNGMPGENYLLSGYNLSLRSILKTVAREMGRLPPKRMIPKWMNTPLFYLSWMIESIGGKETSVMADSLYSMFKFRYFSNMKAERQLGWKPSIPFERTIKESVEWLRRHGYLEE